MAREPGSPVGLSPRLASVRTGVAGWSYPDWKGIVYPSERRADALTRIARYVDTVEVNSPFYRIPTAGTTRGWLERCRNNPRFRFTVKLYREFTHARTLASADEVLFKRALAPLVDSDALGGLLLQFPWSFKYEPESLAYLETLTARFSQYPTVVEVRHQSWQRPEFFDFLRERSIGFCNIDQPVIGRSLGASCETTGPVAYFRFHGRNYERWFDEDAGRDERYDYLYTAPELDPWIERISETSETASETFVITNNHFRGQAVVNALQIRARVEGRKVRAPATLIEHYPVLRTIAEPEFETQGRLF